MRVKLISMTENPIDLMWTAARTCYSEKSPIEIWDETRDEPKDEFKQEIEDKRWNLVKTVLSSGHQSIAEYVNFVFAIEGISRACSHQLVRHRIAVFSQQSQRYVEFKESYDTLTQAFDGNTEQQEQYLKAIAEKYFVDVTFDNYRDYIQALINYLGAVKRGVKAEDARNILPNATKTNLVMGMNLRQLMHVSNLRLCTRAQKEIRQLFNLIKKEVESQNIVIGQLLVPSCDVNGFCTEHKCCGRKSPLKDIQEYETVLSDIDFTLLMDSCKDPKVNEKLAKLLKMENVLDE